MSERRSMTDFRYILKNDYDRGRKINGEKVPLYSAEKLKELYPGGAYTVRGETYERRKRDKEHDIGRIELADKWLYVGENGQHSRFFRKEEAFAEVEGGGYIALLKLRLLPFLILLGVLLGGVGIALIPLTDKPLISPTGPTDSTRPVAIDEEDPSISVIEELTYTISGTVTKAGEAVSGAVLTLQKGSIVIAETGSDENGAYLFDKVSPGKYNVVCTAGESVLTKLADVVSDSPVVDFAFPADDLHDVEEITDIHDEELLPESQPAEEPSDVKALVKTIGEDTPAVAVGGLDIEALLHMEVGKEVDLTLTVEKPGEETVPPEDKTAIEGISGELELTYLDINLLKEVYSNKVLESSEYLHNTKTVLEIAVPFDSSHSAGTYVFRCHDGEALRFEQLSEKPAGEYRDGTCYVTIDTVYIYTSRFSTYAIGAAATDVSSRGSDMLIFSDGATVNVTEKTVSMYYSHDKTATHNARVELYLTGRIEDLLIAQSGIIPPGNELKVMALKAKEAQLPSDDSYEGYMLVIYLGSDGEAGDTNVQLPVTVQIVR